MPTDVVFDQGFADIFVIRVAGTALDTAALPPLQYALHRSMVKVFIAPDHVFRHGQGRTIAHGDPRESIGEWGAERMLWEVPCFPAS